MPGHEAHSPVTGLRDTFIVQAMQSRPFSMPGAWLRLTERPEEAVARRIRRARRQALALMIGSSLFSVAVLYGIWTLLARVTFSAG
jgi:hypothetical protein